MDVFASVKDVMTKRVITATSDTPLIQAVNHMVENKISGLPVVDKNNRVIGIITEYDIATKGSLADLTSYVRLLQESRVYRHGDEENSIIGSIKRVLTTTVGQVMNSEPLILAQDVSINQAVLTFIEHHSVNPIPIIDNDYKLVGVLSRHDLIKFFYNSAAKLGG
jgi:CBS domain-containing protein